MSKLKPCPFCGGKAEHYTIGHQDGYPSIRCAGKFCSFTLSGTTFESVEKKWNTRHADNKLTTITKQRDGLLNGIECLVYKLQRAQLDEYEHSAIDCIKELLSTIKEQKDAE